MKIWIKALIGLGIIVLGVLLVGLMKNSNQETVDEVKKEQQMVSTQLVVPTSHPFVIEATGSLTAKKRIELYSEVQGILVATQTDFKEGNRFYKNQTLLQINSSEYQAQLLSTRSAFLNRITSMLPDMEVDFPEASVKWQSYLEDFKVNRALQTLPEPTSEAERLFLTGKGIYENFYTVKNQEERLSKYTLKAPFGGVVTESLVTTGTLVRNGQKLGEFIDPSLFEIKLEVPSRYTNYIALGKEVLLESLDTQQKFQGKISRINAKISSNTQTITVVVEIAGTDLKEGQFLQGTIFGKMLENVVKIDNNLLIENNQVYVVKDGVLQLQEVEPMNYVGDSVLIGGLKANTILVDEVLANVYPGMNVLF
ncbi:efflux RND transporter periplasmic adaptor subunit [Flagellimonas meridianipacifica]|uniref:RND family efflux transporter MFP subunit n=1 Tax=Flagellimonas meridianipacifica TaxID=1080225 RepID=A0A2T0MD50_9FLAO|nr:HlyD family efflux transporter periplasmic adaptor subunit [Allomuricauda pacifica]PRX55393.1 RND family efflux transporter MFP subunit [Allomuricauda pacifica]